MTKPGQDSPQGPDPTRPHPARQGERDFEDWAAGHADQLMRTAVFLTGDHHTAEDLLQDTLERTYLHWRRVSEPAAYARTVMARAVTDRWRRVGRRPREVPLDALWPDHTGQTNQQPDHLNARAELAGAGGLDAATRYVEQDEAITALRQLSPRQRAVLVLRYYEDWSEAQIADALNCSTGTVKTQASRGLARLRQLLGTDRADPPDKTSPPEGTAAVEVAAEESVTASRHPVPSLQERIR